MSELALFDFQVLMYIVNAPREQVQVQHLLPVVNRLRDEGLVSSKELYPDSPDLTIWMATAAGIELVRKWQEDGNNRHRQYGLDSVLPK